MIDKGRCYDGFLWKFRICECNSCDVGEHLDCGNCKCRKRLNDKLVLECEDEILHKTDTISITNKKVTCKHNCFIYITLLIIMCLILLAIVSISCFYYYYTRYCLKKEYSMPC